MHQLKIVAGAMRNILSGQIKLTAMVALLFLMGVSTSTTPAYAQQISSEQRQMLQKLSPEQRQTLKMEFISSGGVMTPSLAEKIKAQAEAMSGQTPNAPQAAGVAPKQDQALAEEQKTKEPVAAITPQQVEENKAAAAKEERKFEKKVELPVKNSKGKTVDTLERFGFDAYIQARKRILTMEQAISNGQVPATLQKDALAGFIGPLDMINSSVNASVPQSYVLSPGDAVSVYYWGDMTELTVMNLVLDERGYVSIPKAGKLMARGMSLPQFQKAVQDSLTRVLGKDAKVIATLDKLKSMQIQIVGEAFRPGSYAVSAVTTLYNALYAAGGPNEDGSLRDIRLIRKNQTLRIDVYDYLLNGNSKSDYPLQAGDTIMFGRRGNLASILGEVNRPAVYELKKSETLRDLVKMANGIKPTGLSSKVHIQTLDPNKQRAVVDVDMSKDGVAADRELFDGDVVTVEAIIGEIRNLVTLSGNVKVSGSYELKKNMRVADLFNEINEPWGEAYLDRADIIRLGKDRKTTTIIPINLGKALAKDPAHNLELKRFDQLFVYSKWDVQFYPERKVEIKGAVQKPNEYARSEGMRVKDLLLKAGNTLPDAYLERADLLRYIFEKDIYATIAVNLAKLLSGDEKENILLSDKDALRVYTMREASFIPPHNVVIRGSVQRPAEYPRSEGMRIKDLLSIAGNTLPDTHLERADLIRYNFESGSYLTIPVNLGKLLSGDEKENILLSDKDALRIYDIWEANFIPPHTVDIHGNVQRPGTYTRTDGMRFKDLLVAAGGLLPGSGNEAMISRARSFYGKAKGFAVNLELLAKGDESQNILLDDEDVVMIREDSDFFENPRYVEVRGEVKFPGKYPILKKDYHLSELIKQAGGFSQAANPKGAVFTRKTEFLPSPEQRNYVQLVNKIENLLNDEDSRRQSTRNLVLLQQEARQAANDSGVTQAQSPAIGTGVPVISSTGTDVNKAVALGMAPSISQAAGQSVASVMGTFSPGSAITSQARALAEHQLAQSERIVFNLEKGVKGGNEEDLVLVNGDAITIPRKTETASVVGAVMNPVTVNMRSRRNVDELINIAGGYAIDANQEGVLIMRVDGSVLPISETRHVEEGDVVYVPTKVISTEIATTTDKVINALKFTLATVASVIVFLALI